MEDRSEIAFFDLETTLPPHRAIWEFGAILVCSKKLVELDSYSTLVRLSDLSLISSLPQKCNDIRADIISAPTFLEISDKVYDLLHGRIWAGHNILAFDCPLIKEAFEEIGKTAPEPKGTIDSLELLTQKFGRRAGDMKMESLANYFELGHQSHRSLDDVRMNLDVVKYCAAVLFMESSLPDIFKSDSFLEPAEVSIPSISASLVRFSHHGGQKIKIKIKILHEDVVLQLCSTHLRVRFGINRKFFDHAGRPRLNFVVDAPSSLYRVLDACDDLAKSLSTDSGSSSEWRPVVMRENGYHNSSTVRLNIPIVLNGEVAMYATEIYHQDSSGDVEKLVFSTIDHADELDALFTPGTRVDAYFSLDPYDYRQSAGIRLVAKKLIIHSTY